MNVLIVGADTYGSWQMRGLQLGKAIGARVTLGPSADDWAWADLVVLVKRAAMQFQAHAARFRGPVVWDALDFWTQPEQNGEPIEQRIEQARHVVRTAGVSVTVGATRAMADDLGGVYLSHHCRLGLLPTPPRKQAQVVGYDGQKKYLGLWAKALESSCAELGLRFVVNPPKLSDVDALVSFRDGKWDGEVCRQWKSGVKQVNAICAGRPILSQPSAAQSELVPIGVTIEDVSYLTDALEQITSLNMRESAYQVGRTWYRDFHVDAIAQQYLDILKRAERRAA